MDRTESDPKERLLAAAARYFRSPDYGIFSDVAVKRIAADAGMSEAQARRYFSVDDLHDELVRYLLTPGRDPDGAWYADEVAEFEPLINSPSVRLDEILQDIMDVQQEANVGDRTQQARHVLMVYAESSPMVARRLIEAEEYWLRATEQLLISFVARHADIVHLRNDWLSIEDFAVIINALAGATGLETQVRRSAGQPDAIGPGALGRVLRALIGSMLQFHDEDEHPLDAQYRRLHERRNE